MHDHRVTLCLLPSSTRYASFCLETPGATPFSLALQVLTVAATRVDTRAKQIIILQVSKLSLILYLEPLYKQLMMIQ
jgi:hypothetical protein